MLMVYKNVLFCFRRDITIVCGVRGRRVVLKIHTKLHIEYDHG